MNRFTIAIVLLFVTAACAQQRDRFWDQFKDAKRYKKDVTNISKLSPKKHLSTITEAFDMIGVPFRDPIQVYKIVDAATGEPQEYPYLEVQRSMGSTNAAGASYQGNEIKLRLIYMDAYANRPAEYPMESAGLHSKFTYMGNIYFAKVVPNGGRGWGQKWKEATFEFLPAASAEAKHQIVLLNAGRFQTQFSGKIFDSDEVLFTRVATRTL